MKSITKALAVAVFAMLASCSPSVDVTAEGMQGVRREVVSSRSAFEKTALALVSSPITWVNRDRVRHKLGDSYLTESWAVAQVSAAMKDDLLSFMASHKVEAIFVHERRVNFVLRSAGLATSGVSIGVVVAPNDKHGCTVISSPLKLDGRGLLCEKLDGQTYFYLQR